jgi:hypothetical protein
VAAEAAEVVHTLTSVSFFSSTLKLMMPPSTYNWGEGGGSGPVCQQRLRAGTRCS